jgi:hypothetical protein
MVKAISPTLSQALPLGHKAASETAGAMSIQQQFQCVSDDDDDKVSLRVTLFLLAC